MPKKSEGYFLCPATGERHEWADVWGDGVIICYRCGCLKSEYEEEWVNQAPLF